MDFLEPFVSKLWYFNNVANKFSLMQHDNFTNMPICQIPLSQKCQLAKCQYAKVPKVPCQNGWYAKCQYASLPKWHYAKMHICQICPICQMCQKYQHAHMPYLIWDDPKAQPVHALKVPQYASELFRLCVLTAKLTH